MGEPITIQQLMHVSCITVFFITYSSGLITSGADAGSLLEIKKPEFESGFYNSCCIESTDYCSEYRKRRPINNGNNYKSPYEGIINLLMYTIIL